MVEQRCDRRRCSATLFTIYLPASSRASQSAIRNPPRPLNGLHENFTARKASLESEAGFPVFISGLTGPLRIFQRVNGHRHGIDDATTAWYALQKAPEATTCLDLGT